MRLYISIALVVLFSCASLSFGQFPGIIAGPNGDGQVTNHELTDGIFPPNGLAAGWFISFDDEDSLPVVRDDTAGKWIKHLYGASRNDPITAEINGIHPPLIAEEGDKFAIVELLHVFGDASWSDWHEEIRTPGWVWVPYVIAGPTGTDVGTEDTSGLPTPIFAVKDTPFDSFQDIRDNPAPGLTIEGSNTALDFFFNEIEPGKEVAIIKVMEFVGTNDNTGPGPTSDEIFEGFVEIAQFPTPEPLTAGLSMIGMGALMIATRRRRSDRTNT